MDTELPRLLAARHIEQRQFPAQVRSRRRAIGQAAQLGDQRQRAVPVPGTYPGAGHTATPRLTVDALLVGDLAARQRERRQGEVQVIGQSRSRRRVVQGRDQVARSLPSRRSLGLFVGPGSAGEASPEGASGMPIVAASQLVGAPSAASAR